MRHVFRCTSAAVLLLVLTGPAWAADDPWDFDSKDEPSQAATVEQLKTELTEARFKRIIGPIKAKAERAEKAMEPYHKEMEKPVDKRRPRLLTACKERAAQLYVAAAMTAKRARGLVRKSRVQAGIREHFEEPNRRKAISMYLSLGTDAQAENDLRRAVAYYKRVLSLDADNEQAKAGLKQLFQLYQQAMKDRRHGSGSQGGSSEDRKRSWEWDRDSDHNRDWGDWRNYTGNKNNNWW